MIFVHQRRDLGEPLEKLAFVVAKLRTFADLPRDDGVAAFDRRPRSEQRMNTGYGVSVTENVFGARLLHAAHVDQMFVLVLSRHGFVRRDRHGKDEALSIVGDLKVRLENRFEKLSKRTLSDDRQSHENR